MRASKTKTKSIPLAAIQEHLFPPAIEDGDGDEGGAPHVYAVLDGASIPGLQEKLEEEAPEFACLYAGELAPDMAEVAPYLVKLDPGSPFADWVLTEGWGQHWGVFAASAADMKSMRRHFRTFLMVYDPEGKPMYFRWYDPRVLRTYLPTCNDEETAIVFGPVKQYVMEDGEANVLLRFRAQAGDGTGILAHQESFILAGVKEGHHRA